jgi:tRNA (cytidine/uridine-2'-O-)-methyltransferase
MTEPPDSTTKERPSDTTHARPEAGRPQPSGSGEARSIDARPANPRDRLRSDVAPNAPLQVVLVEPQIPPNAGNVARLCAATGCALHLVEPLGFSIDDRELKRAGLDYWHALDVTVHASLEDFLKHFPAERLWLASTRGKHNYANAKFSRGDALVFGKETAGLPAALLAAHQQRTLRIPMREDAVRSLNLSTAVGIVTYAALAQLGFPDLH